MFSVNFCRHRNKLFLPCLRTLWADCESNSTYKPHRPICSYLSNTHAKVHVNHKHHFEPELLPLLLLCVRANTKIEFWLWTSSTRSDEPTCTCEGLRLAYGHLILQFVEVVHGRLFGRHVPSVHECLKWGEEEKQGQETQHWSLFWTIRNYVTHLNK